MQSDLERLNFEDKLWLLFSLLAITNIYGNYNEKMYIKTNKIFYKRKANKIFELTLTVTLFIYIYFFNRNYNSYKKASKSKKSLYFIKVIGSSFLIVAILCLLYFQRNEEDFSGSPAL